MHEWLEWLVISGIKTLQNIKLLEVNSLEPYPL